MQRIQRKTKQASSLLLLCVYFARLTQNIFAEYRFLQAGAPFESLPSSSPLFFLVVGVSGQILPGRPGPPPVLGSEAGSARAHVPGVGFAAACTSVVADERCGSSRRIFQLLKSGVRVLLGRCRGHPPATRVQPGLRLAGLGEGTQVLGEVTDRGLSSMLLGVRDDTPPF